MESQGLSIKLGPRKVKFNINYSSNTWMNSPGFIALGDHPLNGVKPDISESILQLVTGGLYENPFGMGASPKMSQSCEHFRSVAISHIVGGFVGSKSQVGSSFHRPGIPFQLCDIVLDKLLQFMQKTPFCSTASFNSPLARSAEDKVSDCQASPKFESGRVVPNKTFADVVKSKPSLAVQEQKVPSETKLLYRKERTLRRQHAPLERRESVESQTYCPFPKHKRLSWRDKREDHQFKKNQLYRMAPRRKRFREFGSKKCDLDGSVWASENIDPTSPEACPEASGISESKLARTVSSSSESSDRSDTFARTRSTSECSISSVDSDDSFIVFDANQEEDSCSEVSDSSDSDIDDFSLKIDCGPDIDEDLLDGCCLADHLASVNERWNKSYPDKEFQPEHLRKVKFAGAPSLVRVHHIVAWSFAYRAARRGPWEELARDTARFHSRIQRLSPLISPILDQKHRHKIFSERFQS